MKTLHRLVIVVPALALATVSGNWTIHGDEPIADAKSGILIRCPALGGAQIQTIVKNGALVKKGDTLVTFDDSIVQEQCTDRTIEVAQMEAVVKAAIRDVESAKGLTREVLAAQQQVKLTEMRHLFGLEELKVGLANLEAEIGIAQLAVQLLKKRKEAMLNHGLDPASPELMATELELAKSLVQVKILSSRMALLADHALPLKEAELKFEVQRAQLDLAKLTEHSKAELGRAEANLEARHQKLMMTQARLAKVKDQLKLMTISAPQDGRVQYLDHTPSRPGSMVRERMPLLRLIPSHTEQADASKTPAAK